MPTEMGLSILAGALGLGFSNIGRIAKFKGAGFEAEMRMLQTTIEAQIEPTSEAKDAAKKTDSVTELELKVLKSLQRPGYTWRYAKSVAAEIDKTTESTESVLQSMKSRRLVDSGQGSNGEIWTATALGKSVGQLNATNA